MGFGDLTPRTNPGKEDRRQPPRSRWQSPHHGGGMSKGASGKTKPRKPSDGGKTQSLESFGISSTKKAKTAAEDQPKEIEDDVEDSEDESSDVLKQLLNAKKRKQQETEEMRDRVEAEVGAIMDNGVRVNPLLKAMHSKP